MWEGRESGSPTHQRQKSPPGAGLKPIPTPPPQQDVLDFVDENFQAVIPMDRYGQDGHVDF